jgi:hypothetical protein
MADKVVAKYEADVKDYIKDVNKATGVAQKDFEKVNKTANDLGSTLKKIGGAMGIAFGTQQILAFGKEAVDLAAKGEGIRKAFERVGDASLLDGLRQATRGTVSDLNLMKQAVRANNFKIPLESLAKLFEFARRRAKETGESVDYLVNSITMGIGRKSPLILDNLGISAIELRKRFDGISIASANVADVARIVGDIATEEMIKMGDEAITTADKIQQITTSFENIKELVGKEMIDQFFQFTDEIGKTNETLQKLQERFVNTADGVGDFNIATHITGNVMKGLLEPFKKTNDLVDDFAQKLDSAILKFDEFTMLADMVSKGRIDQIQEFLKLSESAQEMAVRRYGAESDALDLEMDGIAASEYMNKILTDQFNLEKANQKQRTEAIKNVAFYKALIKSLTEEQELENTSLERNAQILKELIAAQKALDLLKGKERKASKQDAFEKAQRAQGDLTAMSGVGIGDNFFDDTLEQLKAQLAIQKEILATNSANSLEYVTAKENVEDLTDKIENFGEKSAQTVPMADTVIKDNLEIYEDSRKESAELAKETFASMMQFMAEISDVQRDHEIKNLEEQLQQGLITEEEFQRQRKALARDAAVERKGYAIFGATINTAEAVTNALAKEDFVSAILYGIMGATQIATIAAQPIPQFAKGTKNAPSGFKWVGEEGPELIHDGGGYPIITHRESMKILEKYNIESVDIDSIQRGGFDGMAASAKMQGFSDSNMLVGIDRNRSATVRELRLLRKVMQQSIGSQKRRGNA